MKQAEDFRQEAHALERLLGQLEDADFDRATAFKGWTINQILRHLHLWDRAAFWSLADEPAFKIYIAEAIGPITAGALAAFEEAYLRGLAGGELFAAWRTFYPRLADAFAAADPAQRVVWAGPSMSARSSITARLMETWAHAQAIYDLLGLDRTSTDAIENIVVLGVNTYGWTFVNRQMPAPQPRPKILLTAPSGRLWEYGDDAEDERIEGRAEEFCQVVTQTRNVADTALRVTGANAMAWMSLAQCFAGPPNDPPAPGIRCKAR